MFWSRKEKTRDESAATHKSRDLPADEVRNLSPGSDHYRAYVGPPNQFDFMGATQFRLLTTLGLRETHNVLDIGCGSLRAGRLLMTYLEPGRYFGIEPNRWLIDDTISRELGTEFISLRRPTFSSVDNFDASGFERKFDFIVAQSIFSHTGPDLLTVALNEISKVLDRDGLALATFIHPERLPEAPNEASGWSYPGCTTFRPERIMKLIHNAGFFGRALPWYHPRQTWYALAMSDARLPAAHLDHHLSGSVLYGNEFKESLS